MKKELNIKREEYHWAKESYTKGLIEEIKELLDKYQIVQLVAIDCDLRTKIYDNGETETSIASVDIIDDSLVIRGEDGCDYDEGDLSADFYEELYYELEEYLEGE